MEPYAAEWWSIVPPIVAIGLALLTKEVFSSLLVGIFTGTLIYAVGTDANIVMGTLETAFTMMAKKVDFNILIFCSLLGAVGLPDQLVGRYGGLWQGINEGHSRTPFVLGCNGRLGDRHLH